MSPQSSSVSEWHFKNAVHPQHPHHSIHLLASILLHWDELDWRTQTQCRAPPTTILRPSTLMTSVGCSSSESRSGAQSVLVSASWCPSSSGYLTHRHFGHWKWLSKASWILLLMEKYSFSRKWWISSRTALLSIPNISNCNDISMGKRALTFPVDLTPFQMQKKHITQTRRRHSARSHLIIPISSMPEDKLSTLRLSIWKETKEERDAGAQLMQALVVMAKKTRWCAGQLMHTQISALKTC